MGASRAVAKNMSRCTGRMIESMEGRRLLSASWYVATTGKDTNPGTLAAPFQTIQKAAGLAKAGDTVFIRGGTYRETVKPLNSGTAAAPILFTAYHSEVVTVSGADPITGWSLVKGTLPTYSATQSWDLGTGNNQLFVDGQMMFEARWPNPSGDIERLATSSFQSVVATNTTATIKDPALTQPTDYWKGTYIQMGAGQDWFQQTSLITASGPGFLTFSFTLATGQPPYDTPMANNRYFLFGNPKLMDAKTEWTRDPSTGKVSLIPKAGVDPAKHDVEAKHRQFAFDVSGRSYITLDHINIFAATIASNAASNNLVINHLNAQYLTHWMLQPTGHAPNSSTGIGLNGKNDLIENSRITNSAGDGVFLGGTGGRVTNCIISNTDYSGSDSAPVRVYATGCQIDHSTIAGAGQDGILIRAAGTKILYNSIHDAGLQTTDTGGIYAIRQSGAGGEIAYNRISNVMTGGFGGSGIQLDDYCNNFLLDHNVTWNVNDGLKITFDSMNNRIFNNTFDATAISLQIDHIRNWTGTQIFNNIFLLAFRMGANAKVGNNLDPTMPAPLFVDHAGRNYQLQAGSPGIDKGVVIAPFTNGYKGTAPDIGAYEVGVSPFVVGAVL